jgi:hypothetical protein
MTNHPTPTASGTLGAMKLPWYCAIVRRTPRGRRLRWRAFVTLFIVTAWWWVPFGAGFSPILTAKRYGLVRDPVPVPWIPCQHNPDCPCEGDGVPICMNPHPVGRCGWVAPAQVAARRERRDAKARDAGMQCRTDDQNASFCWPADLPADWPEKNGIFRDAGEEGIP